MELGLGYKMTVYSLSETNLCAPPFHISAVKFRTVYYNFVTRMRASDC